MKFKRVNDPYLLDTLYAPGKQQGEYHVLSQAITDVNGCDTLVGHILLINGKPKKCWWNVEVFDEPAGPPETYH